MTGLEASQKFFSAITDVNEWKVMQLNSTSVAFQAIIHNFHARKKFRWFWRDTGLFRFRERGQKNEGS